MKTFIEEHKKGLVISAISFLTIPCVMALLMQTFFRNIGGGTDDGWLGFWGGYLGAIIAVIGIYVQINSERKQSEEEAKKQIKLLNQQLSDEKENQYRQERPFFLISFKTISSKNPDDKGMNGERVYCSDNYLDRKRSPDNRNIDDALISLNNVSKKDMYAVKILSTEEEYKSIKNHPEACSSVSINKISANSIAYMLFGDVENIKWISVWYITEIRESIKLYFKVTDVGFEYKACLKEIENQQQGNKKTASYDITGFLESDTESYLV